MNFTIPAKGHSALSGRLCNYQRWLMKLTSLVIILFCTGLQLLVARDMNGQNLDDIKVTLELKGETLKAAFKKIEEQTHFRFAYINPRSLREM